MIKKYKSKSSISVNVVLGNGKSVHVAFTPQSDGSSVYATDNADIQQALERHRRFGRLFRLSATGEAGAARPSAQTAGQERKSGKRTVKVSDIAAAKDFLADTFGTSRTSLRSEKAILEAARQHGIEFEGLEQA